MKILFVCTGNICRSPMAEALLKRELGRRGVAGIDVSSAATWGAPGFPATDEAVGLLRARGIDLTGHRSTELTSGLLDRADLVVAMTSVHRRDIERLAPGLGDKLVLMKELAEIRRQDEGTEAAGATAAERLAGFRAGGRPAWRRALDLDDPYGLGDAAYGRALGEIEAGVEVLVDVLAGPAQVPAGPEDERRGAGDPSR